tara:strand:- start:814 stop:1737 length:924 start_codon:yes stop_codon:yes gene_type:complete
LRNAFAREIKALASQDPSIVLLSGDIGNRLFDEYKASFPNRFYNCGVAEANMIGVAAGLAMSGLRPVCYTITPFITYRCLEQIRIDVSYHDVPVVIVGTGSGLSYASLGATHHSCDEMGMLRLMPNLTVLAPADEVEVRLGLKAALDHPHPSYMRIGKKGEPVVHKNSPSFSIGKVIKVREGRSVCLLSTGTILPVAVEAAELLEKKGVSAAVFSMPFVKPLDEEFLEKAFSQYDVVATIEEHSVLGGLGGSIAEWSSDHWNSKANLIRFGTRDEFLHITCDQEKARQYYGLTPNDISSRICEKHNV